MSSENKGLFEEILADETLAGVAEYLYDNTDVTIDRRGYVESVDVPDIEFAENYAYISEEDYNKIAEAIREQAKNVRYYDGYILLNDNHTLHQIDNPEFDEYDYSTSVEDACEAFRLETGLSLYLLGRSGRRVCVEDSFSSFVNYDYLKEIQEKLENEVIAKHTVNESANEQVTDNAQFIIVGITKDGNRQFYNVSSAPHWVDDCDDATIFDDQTEAHKIFYEIDKKPFKRVFVPNFDRAALKEELDVNKIDENEFLTVTEQIASFLKGMGMDMDDVSGKITHYDVNMFTDCCEDRIRIKWTSYMDKKRVKSNSKILPAMLTQMMADDTRFDEVVDIFVNEVDNEVIHNSDLGAISVEMIASDEFEPKTEVEEVKEAYVHARSEDDIREIDTGLTHKIDYIILGDVQGQLSDGIWENSPAMNKYWKHLDTEFKDGKVFIVVNNIGHFEDAYRGTKRDFRFLESPFRHMSDDEIKKWVANKIKQIAKHEAQDNDNAPEYAWRADNNTELEYFDSVVTVADAYRTWSKLLGRPVKNPIDDIIIKTTPELEIGDVINGKVLTEIKPDEKDNYWSYLVFENGDEQKVSKHQNHKVNKPTEETFNESVEDENKFAQYVFPLFTEEDKEKAKYYGLVVDDEDEDNTYVSGSYKDIKSFADNYLGYELVDDYLTIYESKECKESVYAEEPASKEEIEYELKNITHNFTDRQGTAKCSFKEEADIGHDILKQYYDKVKVEEQGEWYHLIYKDLLELDESVKEDISADNEVVIGLYGDEVSGFDSVDQLAQNFEDNGIEVIYKSGDMEYGWDLEVKGNARDIYRIVNGKITGYNCNSTQEFVDRYRIDESKSTMDYHKDKLTKITSNIATKIINDGWYKDYDDETSIYNEVVDFVQDILHSDNQDNYISNDDYEFIKDEIDVAGIRNKNAYGGGKYEFDTDFCNNVANKVLELSRVKNESKSINEDFAGITALADDCGKNTFKVSTRDIRFTFENEDDKTKFVNELSSSNIPHNELTFGVISINKSDALDESKSIKIAPDSKNKEIDIEDKSEVGAIGHPIKVGLGDPIKKSTNENIELCRKYFKSLEKDTDGNYIVLNDGNFENYISAENDEDAINKFKNYTTKKITKESKEMVKNILSKQLKDNKVKPFKDAKECPRGFAFKSSNGSSGQVRYNGKDYVFAIVDGELRVMTDAEAGSNWSETIYKK